MPRDLLFLPGGKCVSTDFSQSVGPLPHDQLKVPFEIAVDMAIRTAMAEIISIGGIVEALSFTNSMGNEGFDIIRKKVQDYEKMLGFKIETIVSSESNFSPKETAIGVTAIGNVGLNKVKTPDDFELRLLGIPLVGKEVLEYALPSLKDIQMLIRDPNVYEILPVGSKGIANEAMHFGAKGMKQLGQLNTDLKKSAGPATCFLLTSNRRGR